MRDCSPSRVPVGIIVNVQARHLQRRLRPQLHCDARHALPLPCVRTSERGADAGGVDLACRGRALRLECAARAMRELGRAAVPLQFPTPALSTRAPPPHCHYSKLHTAMAKLQNLPWTIKGQKSLLTIPEPSCRPET